MDSHGRSTQNITVGKKVACDRCRGQKLRCIWDTNTQRCRRCAKAKTKCMILPPQPMGRPLRHSHRGNAQSKHHRNQIRHRGQQQQTELMQPHLQYAQTCTMMEQDDEDIQDTLTEVARTDSESNTNHETIAQFSIDTLPIGHATHFPSPSFPIDKQCVCVPPHFSFSRLIRHQSTRSRRCCFVYTFVTHAECQQQQQHTCHVQQRCYLRSSTPQRFLPEPKLSRPTSILPA